MTIVGDGSNKKEFNNMPEVHYSLIHEFTHVLIKCNNEYKGNKYNNKNMKSSIFLTNKSAVLFMPPSSPDNLPRDEVQLHNPLCNIMSNQRDSHFDTKSIIHSI